MPRRLPRCPDCEHLASAHTVGNSRYANWGIGCTTAGCRCPAYDWTQPPRPDYVIKPWALMQLGQQAYTAHQAIAAGEAMVAGGAIDRHARTVLRRGYIAGVDILTALDHLAEHQVLVEAFDSRLLGVDKDLLHQPPRRRPAG